MPGRLRTILDQARGEQRLCLLPFLCAGYPAGVSLGGLIEAAARGGAAGVEIGFPYSDPVADGPVIASAMHEALGRGVTPSGILEEIRGVRGRVSIALVAMVSVSILHKMGGLGGAASRLKDAGFDGVIVPDLPIEEASPLTQAAEQCGLDVVMLIGPETSKERAGAIVKAATGFVYLLARAGVTGDGGRMQGLDTRVDQVRTLTDAPIAVGFGISTPEHVREATRRADAAIVGSALVGHLGATARGGGSVEGACEGFVRSLAAGLTPA